MMKHWLVCLFISVSAILTAQNTMAETINMGYFLIPPHVYVVEKNDTPQGASIAYFDIIAAKMSYDVKWIGPFPLPRLLQYLKQGTLTSQGRLDGVIHFGSQGDGKTFLYYPENPYYLMQSVLAVTRDNPLEQIRAIDDISGYRVGLIADAPYTQFIAEHREQLHVETIPGDKWVEQNLRKLLANRLDAFYDLNQYTILFEATQLHLEKHIKVLPLPELPQGLYAAFAKTSAKGEILVELYNTVVQQVNLDYHEFVKQEFDAISRDQ